MRNRNTREGNPKYNNVIKQSKYKCNAKNKEEKIKKEGRKEWNDKYEYRRTKCKMEELDKKKRVEVTKDEMQHRIMNWSIEIKKNKMTNSATK